MKCINCLHPLGIYKDGLILHFGSVLYCQYFNCNCNKPEADK